MELGYNTQVVTRSDSFIIFTIHWLASNMAKAIEIQHRLGGFNYTFSNIPIVKILLTNSSIQKMDKITSIIKILM